MLLSYELAYDSEDPDLLASLLDERDPGFATTQISNAQKLFHEFENIDMTLSEFNLHVSDGHETCVELHLSITAALASTGTPVELLDSGQTLTLRRTPGIGWKISAIE